MRDNQIRSPYGSGIAAPTPDDKRIRRYRLRAGLSTLLAAFSYTFFQALPVVQNPLAIGISKVAEGDHDEVDERPDAASSQSNELQNAGTYLTYIEAVHTETAQKETEQKCYDPILRAFIGRIFSGGG